MQILPKDAQKAMLVGRIWYPQYQGPCLVAVQDGDIYDMTSIDIPTMRDLLELEDCTGYVVARLGKAKS